jgi:(S)-3,5-dihydroxyphenylglycine transaminase
VTEGLAARFAGLPVTWNVPAGGFFVVVNVPFPVDDALLERSARDYGVLWTPMHHFYAAAGDVRSLRLSCSTVTAADIDLGLDRLAALVSDELARIHVTAEVVTEVAADVVPVEVVPVDVAPVEVTAPPEVAAG